MKRTVCVERTTTEHADIEIEIDLAELASEGYDDSASDGQVRSFIETHRDYPENIHPQLSRALVRNPELLHACSWSG